MSRAIHCLAAIALLPAALHAQPELSPGEARREAGRRFNEGMRLADAHAWAGALEEFDAAYRLMPDYRVLALLAECHEELGHLPEAAQALDRYLADGGGALARRERRDAERALSRLVPRVFALTVRTAVAGAEIVADGRTMGASPLPRRVFLAPGPHRLEARRTGYRSEVVAVTATAGGASSVELPIRAIANVATLVVESAPSGLALAIDGQDVGMTPHRSELPAGSHHLVLSRAGYPPRQRDLDLAPESEERVVIGYEGVAGPASLTLVGGAGAELSIDGGPFRRLGAAEQVVEIERGPHRFRVRGIGRESVDRRIDLDPGDRLLLRASAGSHREGIPMRIRWIGVAVSGALLSGAGLTGLFALGEQSTWDDLVRRIAEGQYASQAELANLQAQARDARSSGERLATISDVLLVIGGIAATATLGAFVFGSGERVPPSLVVEEAPGGGSPGSPR